LGSSAENSAWKAPAGREKKKRDRGEEEALPQAALFKFFFRALFSTLSSLQARSLARPLV